MTHLFGCHFISHFYPCDTLYEEYKHNYLCTYDHQHNHLPTFLSNYRDTRTFMLDLSSRNFLNEIIKCFGGFSFFFRHRLTSLKMCLKCSMFKSASLLITFCGFENHSQVKTKKAMSIPKPMIENKKISFLKLRGSPFLKIGAH